MKVLCCFGACGRARIAPALPDQSKQYLVQGTVDSQISTSTGLHSNRDAHYIIEQPSGELISREAAVKAANQLEVALGRLLAAAALMTAEPDSTDRSVAQPYCSNRQLPALQGTGAIPLSNARLPKDITALHERLVQACTSMVQPITSISQAVSEASACLLAYHRQQQQQQLHSAIHRQRRQGQVQQQQEEERLHASQESQVSSADALVNIISVILFTQVTLDSASVLQRRYIQYSGLLSTFGLQDSRLAACVGPANKATLAYLVSGSKAAAGEAKVSVVVHRRAAFWDALEQLQQQHIVPANAEQQAAGPVQLAKLFPRFVDESLQQQQVMMVSAAGQKLGNSGSSSSGSGGSSNNMQAVEGGEGHGPRKEFFQLIGENLKLSGADKAQQPLLFVHLRGSGTWWFNTTLSCSLRLQAAYWAVGWLLGQALANRCTVGVQLAPLLFDRLLLLPHQQFKPSMDVLQQHDPEAAQGLSSVLQLQVQQYQQLLQVEGHLAGLSKQEYVQHALQQLLVEDVAWQFKALKQGFCSAVDCQVLLDCCFTGVSLAAAICGQPTDTPDSGFDIRQVFRITLEDEEDDHEQDEGYSTVPGAAGGIGALVHSGGSSVRPGSVAALLQCLWEVLGGWSPQQKRAFVKFVTGSDRLPSPGSEQLIFSFPFVAYGTNQQRQLLGTLPQSHTCANTLELPNYLEALVATEPQLALEWQEARMAGGSSSKSRASAGAVVGCRHLLQRCCEVLEDRLMMAITSCDGYGLDTLIGATGAMPGPSSHSATQQAVLAHQPTVVESNRQSSPHDLGSVNNSISAIMGRDDELSGLAAAAAVNGALAIAAASSSIPEVYLPGEGMIDAALHMPVQEHARSLREHSSGLYQQLPQTQACQQLKQQSTQPRPQQCQQQQQQQQQPPIVASQQPDEQWRAKQRNQQQECDNQTVGTAGAAGSKPKLLSESDEEFLDQILDEGL